MFVVLYLFSELTHFSSQIIGSLFNKNKKLFSYFFFSRLAMGRKMKIDEAMAEKLAGLLKLVLPPSAKQQWQDGVEGARNLMTVYRCIDMYQDPTDWDDCARYP